MKVLFIYPNSGSQVGFNYGVAHLAGMLKEAGHEAVLWQFCEELAPLPDRESFVQGIRRIGPDILAFSVVTNQWGYTQTLARWARESFTGALVCGGVHALVSPREILETGLFDYIFRGESEEAFLEFVEKLSRGEPVEDVRNLGLMRDSQVCLNPVRALPILEDLPVKDYDIMNFQRLIDVKKGWVGLMASRGCPFSCTYCFNHKMVATYQEDLHCRRSELNYIRRFRVDQLIGEIRYLLDRYHGIKMFIFDDDLFTFNKDYVKAFCEAYRKTCAIPFVVNAHVNYFDEETARTLAGAGCRVVKFGVESGSPKIRRSILNRHMTNEKIEEAIRLVGEQGMHSSVFIIIGFPHEGREEVLETVDLLGRARPGRFRWTFFFPFPGTKAHEISVAGGYINATKMQRLTNFTDDSCLDFDSEQNLLLKKIGRIMPWFVNARAGGAMGAFYREKVDRLLALDELAWERVSPDLHEEDKAISADFARRGESHYAIKYNPFMGVISDYFLNET